MSSLRQSIEDILNRLKGRVQIRMIIRRLHIDGGLHAADIEFPEANEAAADIANQFRFKAAAVEALEHYFAQLQQKNIVH